MILVTGAAGLIGKRLVENFNKNGVDNVPLYHSQDVEINNKDWNLDLTRIEHFEKFYEIDLIPETVVHLAGHIEISLRANEQSKNGTPLPGSENISKIYSSNLLATANIIDFCLKKGVKHLIFSSSQTVYGIPSNGITDIDELTPLCPLEHYAASKVCCEEIIKVASKQRLKVTILRIPGVFSEERRNGVVFNFCKSGILHKKILVAAEFPLPFDVIHVDDVVSAIILSLKNSKFSYNCFNISTGEPCSLEHLAHRIAEKIEGCDVVLDGPPQPLIQLNSSKAKNELRWEPSNFGARLQSMIEVASS